MSDLRICSGDDSNWGFFNWGFLIGEFYEGNKYGTISPYIKGFYLTPRHVIGFNKGFVIPGNFRSIKIIDLLEFIDKNNLYFPYSDPLKNDIVIISNSVALIMNIKLGGCIIKTLNDYNVFCSYKELENFFNFSAFIRHLINLQRNSSEIDQLLR